MKKRLSIFSQLRFIAFAMMVAGPMLFAAHTFAESASATDSEQRLEQIRLSRAEIERTMHEVQQKLNVSTEEISTLKARSRAYTPYTDFRLKKLLKSSNELAKQLTDLESQRRRLAVDEKTAREQTVNGIDKRLEQLAKDIAVTKRRSSERRAISKEIGALVKKREKLADTLRYVKAAEKTPYAAVSESDSLEDMQEKAAFLKDARKRLKKTARELRKQVKRARRQQILLTEVRHFLDEESFFAETSFAKRNPGNANAQDTTTLGENNGTESAKTNDSTDEVVEGDDTVADTTGGDETLDGGLDGGETPAAIEEGGDDALMDDETGGDVALDVTPEEPALDAQSLEGIRRVNIDRISAGSQPARRGMRRLEDLRRYQRIVERQIESVENNLRVLESVIDVKK